jgi:hypothetical protein
MFRGDRDFYKQHKGLSFKDISNKVKQSDRSKELAEVSEDLEKFFSQEKYKNFSFINPIKRDISNTPE